MTPTLADAPVTPPTDPSADVNRWLTPPTPEEAHAEWMRYNRTPAEVLDPDLSHFGQYIAFFDGKPWGYDHDAIALREGVSAEFGIHPDRLFIDYLG